MPVALLARALLALLAMCGAPWSMVADASALGTALLGRRPPFPRWAIGHFFFLAKEGCFLGCFLGCFFYFINKKKFQ